MASGVASGNELHGLLENPWKIHIYFDEFPSSRPNIYVYIYNILIYTMR